MGLSEIEEILSRLSADDRLRARFVENPFSLGRELGLSVAESRQLRREAATRFNSFAATARERRLVEMGKLLPLTRHILQSRFAAYFNRYAAAHEPGGIERLFGDALDFADFLEKSLRADRVGSGWTLELLRYEKARLRAADPDRRLVVAVFRHDISRLVRSVARKEEQPIVVRRPTLAAWWRSKRRTPVRYAVFSRPRLFGGVN
ncbi:MAG: hypothetical protein QOC99_2171 [Acidobacteriota bacterium]|jgi:hypothetical protein|nr:hypothetical protein [Acidobacteriota bacterium]MDT7779659.1 hypothetical protein [Acidobacteriota bacterium]